MTQATDAARHAAKKNAEHTTSNDVLSSKATEHVVVGILRGHVDAAPTQVGNVDVVGIHDGNVAVVRIAPCNVAAFGTPEFTSAVTALAGAQATADVGAICATAVETTSSGIDAVAASPLATTDAAIFLDPTLRVATFLSATLAAKRFHLIVESVARYPEPTATTGAAHDANVA